MERRQNSVWLTEGLFKKGLETPMEILRLLGLPLKKGKTFFASIDFHFLPAAEEYLKACIVTPQAGIPKNS